MKPPAFQFYPSDFISGTASMTPEEVGVYMRLLCYQWDHDAVPNDDSRIGIIVGYAKPDAIAHAKTKFRLCEDGLLRNDRLEMERDKQRSYRDKQSKNGAKRWLGYAKPDAVAMPSQEGWECPPSPSPSPSPSTKLAIGGGENSSPQPVTRERVEESNIPTIDDVVKYGQMIGAPILTCTNFFNHYEGNNTWVNQHGKMIHWKHKLAEWRDRDRNPKPNANNHRGQTPKPNPRNVGICRAGPDYGEAAKRKQIQQQNEEREREVARELALKEAGASPLSPESQNA